MTGQELTLYDSGTIKHASNFYTCAQTPALHAYDACCLMRRCLTDGLISVLVDQDLAPTRKGGPARLLHVCRVMRGVMRLSVHSAWLVNNIVSFIKTTYHAGCG